jgi:protein gp37
VPVGTALRGVTIMADKTAIEWADATINPVRARRMDDVVEPRRRMGWHCEHVSEGCRNCYAEALNRDRFGTGLDYKPGHLVAKGGTVKIYLAARALTDMLSWRRPRRIFVCSMTDLFADFVPDWMIDRVFAAMALAPQHTFMLLTKRPERMREYLFSISAAGLNGRQMEMRAAVRDISPEKATLAETEAVIRVSGARETGTWAPLPNVWLGVTAEDQTRADERIPVLLATPAAKRFVSVEPMLGAVDLTNLDNTGTCRQEKRHGINALWKTSLRPRLDWVICGGESGPNARPRHPVWVRSLRDQCAAAGVAFFDKQQGEWAARSNAPTKWSRAWCARNDGTFVSMDDYDPATCEILFDVGKRAAGRLLDGVEHLAFPET